MEAVLFLSIFKRKMYLDDRSGIQSFDSLDFVPFACRVGNFVFTM